MNVSTHPSKASEVSPRVVSEEDAARYLGISRSTLRKGRMSGRSAALMSSPPFLKIGRRVGYLIEDLDAWLRNCRQVNELATGNRP